MLIGPPLYAVCFLAGIAVGALIVAGAAVLTYTIARRVLLPW